EPLHSSLWHLSYFPSLPTGTTETVIRTSACGNDTTIGTHSFYIIVLPSPPPGSLTLTITPNIQLCPGDSAILVVSGGTSYIWSNGSTNDTLVVYQPGQYSVAGFNTVTNSNGCSAITSGNASVTVSVTQQPLVLMFPSDGIICPGDSVELVASGIGIFSWQGPNGAIGGNTNTIWVTSPGTYYCVLMTPDSCQLLSNSVNILQYNTPSIQASPSGILCPGDTIVISLTASSGSSVIWQPPLSGSSLTQTITQPGVYSCTVLACNITTTVSITISATAVSAVITPLGSTTVCQGDSLQLQANPGMFSYDWSPGNSTGQSIYAYVDGTYYLTTSDSGGCVANDSFQVVFTPNLLTPPLSQDTTVCAGTPATLVASGAPVLTWYNAPTGGTVLGTGSTLVVTPQNTTSYYVLTNDGVCKSQPEVVTVTTEDCSPMIPNVFTPNGDGINDYFSISELYARSLHVWIYDRWGVLIYEWDGLAGYWDGTYMKDGKPVTDGVYYYIADISDLNNVLKSQSGFIQLIRDGGK
ncbi:MAG TPA: gliding motility-associated C-terminal domain-containing protein, partial [Bacteroidia bacterium]|nr:gliding motility-associated C-terminal domain-containing protein [Bacteroidia bacterium]